MPSNGTLQDFFTDPVFRPFMDESFDVQQYTSKLVQSIVMADHLNKLFFGLSRVESEIEQHVGEHYEELLAQASGIDNLEASLSAIQTRTQTLQAGVERVRARVSEPYFRLQKHTSMLARLQDTCQLLRKMIRCLAITTRLNVQLENCPRDLVKVASSVRELEELYADKELYGITVLETSEKLVGTARKTVEKQAELLLFEGADKHNQTQVGTSLQVFYNLGSLVENVERMIKQLLERLDQTIQTSLDHNIIVESSKALSKKGPTPGKSTLPVLPSQLRAALWSSLEKLMDEIHCSVLQIYHLHKMLMKKKDPVTHASFLSAVEQTFGQNLFSFVWINITQTLSKHFSGAAQGSHFIRQALEVDYPKLVRLYGDLWRRLLSSASELIVVASLSERKEGQTNDPESMLRASLLPLQSAFLSRSLSRLFDVVNLMFSTSNSLPSKQECDALVKTICSEVNVSAVDGRLSESVASNVFKAVQLLCTKCEEATAVDEDAIQVMGPANEKQKLNAGIVNQALYLRTQLERALSANLAHLPLTSKALDTLGSSVRLLNTVIQAGIKPIFDAIIQAIEDILLTMHNEDFSSNDEESLSSSSQQELQSFIKRAVQDYVELFNSCNLLKLASEQCASRCLSLFVWHASLVRPLGDAGKMRLAADFAQVEVAAGVLCPCLADLGDPYRLLRAVRPLLFLTPQHITQVPTLGSLVPYSLVLHLLFSRAPHELKSPHQSANWSVAQYMAWLDQHPSERERLQLLAGCLESYEASVRRAGHTHYAPVYPVMVQVLQLGQQGSGTHRD